MHSRIAEGVVDIDGKETRIFFLRVISDSGVVVDYRIDEEFAPALSVIGQFGFKNKVRPNEVPPVLRKRDPRKGHPGTLRLPVIVTALSLLEPEDRVAVAGNGWRLFEECDKVKGKVQQKAYNRCATDCRVVNWYRPTMPYLVIDPRKEGESLRMYVEEEVIPEPGIHSLPILDDGSVLPIMEETDPQRQIDLLSKAYDQVDRILGKKRPSQPSQPPTSEGVLEYPPSSSSPSSSNPSIIQPGTFEVSQENVKGLGSEIKP